jgi:putative membrane protein
LIPGAEDIALFLFGGQPIGPLSTHQFAGITDLQDRPPWPGTFRPPPHPMIMPDMPNIRAPRPGLEVRLFQPRKTHVIKHFAIAALLAVAMAGITHAATPPTDRQIAHIAYTAGQIDINAAEQALKKSKNADVIAFAQEMARDHQAVNDLALALVKKLGVTPEDNPVSQSLSKNAADELAVLDKLDGAAFDKAYIDNEIAYHKAVNGALADTLIPSAQNAELKALLQQGLTLFTEHQHHAEMLAPMIK